MDRFLLIEAFVTVAKAESFAEAARQMRVSKSVVTTRVQQLEDYVGAPLFHRSTRNVRLSEIGQAYFHDCSDLVCRTDELVDMMWEQKDRVAGKLRIHALSGFVLGHLAVHMRDFQEQYPQIVLDLFVNDAVVDPIKGGGGLLAADFLSLVRGIDCAESLSSAAGILSVAELSRPAWHAG
jgi:DNA-binding transcriptional LysR family regulator